MTTIVIDYDWVNSLPKSIRGRRASSARIFPFCFSGGIDFDGGVGVGVGSTMGS
jgi:hypothetical protein